MTPKRFACTDPRLARAVAPLLLLLASAVSAAPPAAVSPGELARAAEVPGGCPTFSWTLDETAAGYELVVMALAAGAEPQAVLRRRIDGRALAWSTDRAACLPPGEYAWSVRALGTTDPAAPGDPAWAPPRRFAVPSAPSAAEVAAALDTLRRWQATRAADAPAELVDTPRAIEPGVTARQVEVGTSAGAALRGDNPASAGEEYGVLGLTSSLSGAGVAAVNRGAGPDLILDGATTGQADALLREDGIDRPSSSPQSFDIRNTLAGGMTVRVDGVPVVTTATDQDTLGALGCVAGEIPLRGSNLWTCAPGTGATYLAGNQLQLSGNTFNVLEGSGSGLDADLLDGLSSTDFAASLHDHFGQTWIGLATEGLHLTNGVTTSQARALVGEVVAQDGQAVVGLANAPNGSGTGVLGRVSATSGPGTGVAGEVASPDGRGVVGRATAPTGAPRGVYGESASSNDGAGVHGESLPDVGPGAGVRGVAHSFQGAGIVAENLTPGADLWLAGDGAGSTRADLTEAALDRASNHPESFDFRNSGAGDMTLTVDGIAVVTVDTDQDVLGGLSCNVGEVAIRQLAGWTCAPSGGTAYLAGNQLSLSSSTFHVVEGPGSGLDADTVDGLEPSQLASMGHTHYAQTWTGSGDDPGLWVVLTGGESAALRGEASAGIGFANGVEGITQSADGYGVKGSATATTGFNAGVYGRTNSDLGVGVDGYASATTGKTYGVRGVTAAPVNGAAGVYGEGPLMGMQGIVTGDGAIFFNAMGVMGYAPSTGGINAGVFGAAKSSYSSGIVGWGPYVGFNRAGVFFGNVEILGNLTAYSKSFRIDHPLDPEHKILEHASIESSERLNLYTGNVTIGAGGTATVQLPTWFTALNTDFRYQLTPIGAWAQAWIAEEIGGGGTFVVAGPPGQRVSWQVTGVRQDSWALAHPLVVEREKTAGDLGDPGGPPPFLAPGPGEATKGGPK